MGGAMENTYSFEVLKIVFYSGLVILLIYLLGLYLRRLPVLNTEGKRLKVLERVSLGQRQGLYLVRIDGQDLLVGITEGGMKLLKELELQDKGAGDYASKD